MKKLLLSLLLICGVSLAQGQSNRNNIDTLQRKYMTMVRSTDTKVQAELKKELYALTKNNDEPTMTLAMRFFDQLQMRATADSLVSVIKKKFPKGNLAKNSEIQVVYNEKDPVKKEAEFMKYLIKFPSEKFTDKISYDYGRYSIASAYAEAGNPEKAMEYADKLETDWKGEGCAAISNSFKKSGDLENAGKLLKKSIFFAESYLNSNTKGNENRILTLGYYTYCGMYADILYRQKRYDESLAYLLKKQQGGRALDSSEKQIYINLLYAIGRNLEAFLCLIDLVNDGQSTSSDMLLFKDLYVKLNGSDSGYSDLLNAVKKKQTDNIKQKLAKELISQAAPQFSLKDVEGNTVSLDDFKGKIVILDFWATWCNPCKKSFPAMQMTVDKYKNDPNVKFLFIHTWEKEEDALRMAKQYIEENSYSFKVLMDLKDPETKINKVVDSFKVTGIPAKFVIDGNGNIRFRITGFTGSNEAAVEELSTMIEIVRKF